MPASDRLAVTYLFSRSCPSHEEGLELLGAAAASAGVDLEVEAVEVRDDAGAAELGFPGSPTYRIAGADAFPLEGPAQPPAADACRAYRRPGDRIGPLPHHDDLVAALLRAAAAEVTP